MSLNESKSVLEKINNSLSFDNVIAGSNISIEKTNDNKLIINSEGGSGGGESISVDSEMSDSSENPVQNKVVKKYIDDKIEEGGTGGGGASITISEEEGNAIEERQDGIYVPTHINEIESLYASVANLDTRSTTGDNIDSITFSSSSTGDAVVDNTTNILQYLDNIVGDGIEFTNEGFCRLERGKKYKIYGNTYRQDTATSVYLIIKNKNGDELGQKGYMNKGVRIGLPCFYETEILSKEVEIGLYLSTTTTIAKELTMLHIEEIGRTILLDPIKTAQDHEIEEVLFETTTPQTSGNIILPKDFSEFDYLYFEIGVKANNNFIVTTSNEIKVDRLITSNSNSTIDLHGWSDCDVEIYKANNSTIYIRASKTYGIVRIIGKKSKNPVYVHCETIKELSNPLMSSEISQELPIGSTTRYAGTVPPEHYLMRDGKVYNIADYIEFAEWIKREHGRYDYWGGDGITTFAAPPLSDNINYSSITPIMTDYTAPSPYEVTANDTSMGGTCQAYHLFDGDNATVWASDYTTVGWVQLYLGEPIVANKLLLTNTNWYEGLTCSPKNFTLKGSNDGIIYDTLLTVTNDTWTSKSQTKEYTFPNVKAYSYYKLDVTDVNGGTFITLTKMDLLKNNECDIIKFENTHYAINQYGGFCEDVLFDGNAGNTDTEYNTEYPITDYDKITVVANMYNMIDNNNFIPHKLSQTYNVSDLLNRNYTDINFEFLGRIISANFVNHNTFVISSIVKNGANTAIKKIYGTKGSIPTFLEGGVL